jgi:hypothetical protein
VGLIIGLFFLVGGLGLRRMGDSGWPLGETEELLGSNPTGDVFAMIGTIWAGVGGLLLLLFVALLLASRRAGGSDGPTLAHHVGAAHRYGPSQPTVADGLTQLAALKDRGLLSEEEWATAKAMYLGKQSDHRASDVRLLEQLHDLYEAGGLSESEFNAKKWEILARS